MVPVLANVGERATAKNYHSISLLSVLSEGFEKLLNNRFFDHFWNFRSAFGLILSFLSNRRLVLKNQNRSSNRSGSGREAFTRISR